MQALARLLGLVLEFVAGTLLVALAVLVSVAATLRYLGTGISFYDEVAPILLAWVTFFGAALVALKRGHLGFDNVIRALPEWPRRIAFVLAELLTIAFFIAVAWGGHRLIEVMSGEHLVTLRWLSTGVTQSVMPLASLAFIAAELLTLPDAWRRLDRAPPAPSLAPESAHLQ
jgi:TRAP-type C4-dicarboxylate transport system permease small subunit